MSAHTPGPWMADTVGGFTTINVDHRGQTGQTITHMFDRHDSFKNASANAKLIAAAPDMADALLKVQTDIQRTDFASEADRADYVLGYVRAALAKAGL